MKCTQCKNSNVIKHGKTNSGTQRYKCKSCGERFVLENNVDNRVSTSSVKAKGLRRRGFSFRAIGRMLGINHQTASNLQIDEPCVYIVKIAGSNYKIGKTRNIKQRVSALNSEYNAKCTLIISHKCNHNRVEKKMHKMFRDYCIGGEVFNFAPYQVKNARLALMKM